MSDPYPIDPNANNSIDLATIIQVLADAEVVGDRSNYHPTKGRVVEETPSGNSWIGTGDQWVSLDTLTGLQVPSFSTGVTDTTKYARNVARNVKTPKNRYSRAHVGESWESFESGVGSWTASSGSVTADTTESYLDGQSAKMTSTGGANVEIRRSGISPALDLSSKDVSMALKNADGEPAADANVQVFLMDSAGDYLQVATRLGSDRHGSFWKRNDLGARFESGTVDLTDIVEFRIKVVNPGSGDMTVWADDIRFTPGADRGKFIFVFDDGYSSIRETAAPYMAKYGYSGVASVVPDTVGGGGVMTQTQIDELYHDYGWDIVGHESVSTSPSWDSASQSEIEEFAKAVKEYLLAQGYDRSADMFVNPGGNHTDAVLAGLDKFFSMGFWSGGADYTGTSGLYTTEPLAVSRGGDSKANADTILSLAETWNQVGIVAFHAIGQGVAADTMTESEFQTFVDSVQAADVDVITASDFRDAQPGWV